MGRKDKTIATILAFFFGGWGIHRFYLGQTGRGILYLIFSFTTISFIIGFIDFIGFLTMSQKDFDWKYNPHLFGRSNSAKRFYETYGYNRNNPPSINAAPRPQREKQAQRHQKPPMTGYYNARDLLRRVGEAREEIINKVRRSDHFDNDIVRDIRPMVDKYMKQVKELVERQEKLGKIVERNPMHKFDSEINRLKQKATETNNDALKYEYQNTVAKLEKQKETIQEFKDQQEMIGLRLDSTVMSLEQIKFDLIRIETLASDEQRKEFTKLFEEKSADLSTYLDVLKESYNE